MQTSIRFLVRAVLCLAATMVLTQGCTSEPPGRSDAGTDGGVDGGARPLTLSPTTATVSVIDDAQGTTSFTATFTDSTGMNQDVTAQTECSLDDPSLGKFNKTTFTSSGVPGTTTVRCQWSSSSQTAQISILVKRSRVEADAPPNAATLFQAATDDATLAPQIVYPTDNTLFPPNIGDLEAHWVDTAGADLFELSFSAPLFTLTYYKKAAPKARSWTSVVSLKASDWDIIRHGARNGSLQLRVRGLKTSDPLKAGGKTITVSLSQNDVHGGVYYWSPTNPAGLYRHDFEKPESPPESFYNSTKTPPGFLTPSGCVGCHTISPKGNRVALDYQGSTLGIHAAGVIDTATRTNAFTPAANITWGFSTFEPSGERLVASTLNKQGKLSLFNANTGAEISKVPTGNGFASHPDFSPNGDAIAYTLSAKLTQIDEAQVSEGSIVVQSFDSAAGTFGAVKNVAPAAPPNGNYYPSWSPDGKWILFNSSTHNSYNDISAQVYVVKADGSQPPILLKQASVAAGLTNSWPKFAPFIEKRADGKTIAWFTFSTTRPFGVRATGGSQLWMAAFDFERAEKGQDPSSPAFRLPFQGLSTSNHSAQWTQKIIPINYSVSGNP